MNDLNQESFRFTASVMGNPEYLNAIKSVPVAKDERHVGLENLNSYHKHHHDERMKRDAADKKKKDNPA